MSQVQCPNGHFYNNDLYTSCPYCSQTSTPPMPPTPPPQPFPKQDQGSSAIKIISFVSAIIAVGTFFYAQSRESELSDAKNRLYQVTQDYDAKTTELSTKGSTLNLSNRANKLFKRLFGNGGENFHSDVPILVLESGGDAKSFIVYDNNSKDTKFNLLHNYTKNNFTSGCCTDIKAEWKNNNIQITPGSMRGFNIVHVFDNSGKSFDVLIIVQ